MKIELCGCENCRSMLKHSIVRRSLENEFPILLADDYYNSSASKHFICAKWYDVYNCIDGMRLAVKPEYNNINRWNDNQ